MQFHCLSLYQNDLYWNDFVSKQPVSLTLHTMMDFPESIGPWHTVMISRIWKFAVTCTLYLCIIFSGYLLFVCRPKRGILSNLPAELEITGSVEVTDCFSRMFIASPRPNDQPLCHAVLVSLKLNVKMSSEGKQMYSSYFNLCEKLETVSSTMRTSRQKSSTEMVVPQDFVYRFKSCYNTSLPQDRKWSVKNRNSS